MVSTDLGACEWFVWDLRRSNLIDRGQLDQIVGEYLGQNAGAEPPALADFLVEQGILTRFQVDRLLQGKVQGFVLGPFTLMDSLGTGSMGTVYKARSKNDDGWYAVKVLPRRSMWNVRIARRKARAFEECQHPALVPFVDVGTAGNTHYLAWPLVEGETLDRLVQREGKRTPADAALFALQTAEGLDACHQKTLFHGLVKPSNLMITPDQQVRILDCGIGCLLAETEGESLVDTMSTANSVASGLDCASPESIMDPTNLTPAGDQYSLGCVLYYCLAGQYPFADGTAAEKMMAHQFKQPKPIRELNPEIPEALAAVVERLLQKTPEARFGNMTEAAEALQPFATAAAPGPRSVPRTKPVRNLDANGVRSAPQALTETPRPVPAATRATTAPLSATRAASAALPSRHSLQGNPAAPPAPSMTPVNSPDATSAPRTSSWEERLGPIGLGVCAFLACVLAWLLTRNLF